MNEVKRDIPLFKDRSAWDGVELKDWLFKEFDQSHFKTPELQALKRILGAQKIRAYWEEWKRSKK